MNGFIEGESRKQATMFPERLDDYITEENSVRVVDVFIDSLDLSGLRFETKAENTGRPGYHPSTMLKLYVYGYLNRVQSSRRLEREAQRNVELMWLSGRLALHFKTIADFRKDNGKGIKSVCREFVLLCKKLGLLSAACVAVDGSKFKAENNSDRAFSKIKMESRLKKLDESIDRYLLEIKRLDGEDTKEANNTRGRFKEQLAKFKEETKRLKLIEAELMKSPEQQLALTDPDARIMATIGRNSVKVGYNVQSAVDTENHLIVEHEVTNTGNDRAQLSKMAPKAKDTLGCDKMDVLADKGYFKGSEILACANEGITAYLPKTDTSGKQGKGLFVRRDFKYIEEDDELDKRMANEPERMATRSSTVEHPFGTIKSWMGQAHFQMKTIGHVATEMSLHVLAYNLRRVLTILRPEALAVAIRS